LPGARRGHHDRDRVGVGRARQRHADRRGEEQRGELGGFKLQAPVVIPDPLLPVPIVLTDLTVSAKATWSGDLTTKLAWDDDKNRQGADLQVARLAT
jgi:hypothetical protein